MRAMSPFSRDAALMSRPEHEMEAGEHASLLAPRRGRGRVLNGSVGALCLLLASAAQPVAANEFNTNPVRSMMDLLGLSEDEPKPEIDYRERAPLVVPPGSLNNLPSPQESAHRSNPAWPKDPDVARRKREAEDNNKPIIRDDPGRPLMPSELNRGRPHGLLGNIGNMFNGGKGTAVADPEKPNMTPSQLGFTGWFNPKNQEPIAFTGEPERQNLTQPPSGYLTPSPNAPYGVIEDKQAEGFSFPTIFGNKK